jgi:hypothetical protein
LPCLTTVAMLHQQTRKASAQPQRSKMTTTKKAIEQVLKGKPKGLRVPQIIETGVPLATSLKGKTPGQTFYSVLYSESKKADGLASRSRSARRSR